MACVLVPAAEAIIVSTVSHLLKKREEKEQLKTHNGEVAVLQSENPVCQYEKLPFSRKLKWLSNLLWGGSFLLAFEHVWHGEITPFFPFLTAASNPQNLVQMLHEMATVGVTMSVLVTLVWMGMVIFETKLYKNDFSLRKTRLF